MKNRSKIFIIIAVLYWIIPDIIVSVICALANKRYISN